MNVSRITSRIGRPSARRMGRVAALAVTVSTVAGFAAPAQAVPVTVQVRNSDGVSLQSRAIAADGKTAWSDLNGRITLDLEPGQTVQITRPPVSGACDQPAESVTYTATGAPTADVTLPSFIYRNIKGEYPPKPDLQNEERALVGMINDARQAKGLSRLRISTVLNRAADASILAATSFYDDCFLREWAAMPYEAGWVGSTVKSRAVDPSGTASLSFQAINETTYGNDDKPLPLEYLNPKFSAIGVAYNGVSNVIMYAEPCPAEFADRCQVTDDTGDASLASRDNSQTSDRSSSGLRNPKLKTRGITTSRKARNGRKTVTVRIGVRPGAKGTFTVTPYRAVKTKTGNVRYVKMPARKTTSSRTPNATLKLRLLRGTYKLQVVFTPKNTANYKTVTTTKKVRVR